MGNFELNGAATYQNSSKQTGAGREKKPAASAGKLTGTTPNSRTTTKIRVTQVKSRLRR
ncbi:hypothetical protein SLEP1_g34436 [Rubroshorea leprosula]|uniref:Uncharacterized protein n=1 Tax=Rubroshorea leprosula TaxID=152421 RepID=A0AAV5KJW7_9ROSI|nr:hypothetical protein SLEP1_g34436 [Rubroshorea leprosula]